MDSQKANSKEQFDKKRKNFILTLSQDNYFLDLMSRMSRQTWRNTIREMKAKYGEECGKDKLKSTIRSLKADYNHVKQLLAKLGSW
ncbi:hypothetical protein AMTRI_Chr10g230020 [Amborella trichopoda]